jgi:uncharacterized protein (DUF2461 family)
MLAVRDPEFRRSLKDWEAFVETLTEKIIESDETIPELPLKDVIFRIYRDIRFSKDPTPYKVSLNSTSCQISTCVDLLLAALLRRLVTNGQERALRLLLCTL